MWQLARWVFFHLSDGPGSKQTNEKLEEVVLESLVPVTAGLRAWKPGRWAESWATAEVASEMVPREVLRRGRSVPQRMQVSRNSIPGDFWFSLFPFGFLIKFESIILKMFFKKERE